VEWAGVDRWSDAALYQQIARGVKQWLAGEPVRAARPMSPGMVAAVVLAVLFGLQFALIPVIAFMAMGGF
jgi:hypothetical protein